MTWVEVSLIVVVVAFTGLVIYVFAPGNKRYFKKMSEIPLEDSDRPDSENNDQTKDT